MKKIIFIVTLAIVALSGCYKEDNENVINGTAMLTGANSVPATSSAATAKITYAYNANLRTFTYQIDYANLSDSCTLMGIAKAQPGQVLPTATFQQFTYGNALSLQRRTTGTITGSFIVEGQQMILSELRGGLYSVFLRSKAFPTAPGSEVRANITF